MNCITPLGTFCSRMKVPMTVFSMLAIVMISNFRFLLTRCSINFEFSNLQFEIICIANFFVVASILNDEKPVMKRLLLIFFTLIPLLCSGQARGYLEYHNEIIKAEEFIVARQFKESLKIYRSVFDNYEHVFLRDIKVAAQLSAYLNRTDDLFYLLEKGMKKGWTAKEIRKVKIFKKLQARPRMERTQSQRDRF